MPDELNELWQRFKRAVTPGQVVHAAPGETYGDAQTRVSRTPVKYNTDVMPPDQAGAYDAPLSSLLTFGKVNLGPGQITINPMSSEHFSATGPSTTHEQSHAILQKIDNDTLEKLATSAPHYTDIANALTDKYNRAGWMPAEVPAYMSEAAGFPHGQEWLDGFITHLKTVDPLAAQQYTKGAQYTMDTTKKYGEAQ